MPYLYVGDQDQTQIDTISSLNISYILSLQSLPKFLETDEVQADEGELHDQTNDTVNFSEIRPLEKNKEYFFEHNEERKKRCCLHNKQTLFAPDNSAATKQQQQQQHQQQKTTVAPKSLSARNNDLEVEEIVAQSSTLPNQSEAPSTSAQQDDDQVENEQTNSEPGVIATTITTTTSKFRNSKNNKLITDKKGLLPSLNSSKDYLVKIKSCVHRLIRGKCINISDTFEQLLDKFFDETHSFIEEARRNKCNILVHCKAGISRSPTIAIAYLMKWKQLHLQDAYDFVKRCRPQISPNLNFMGQLMTYERMLLQRSSPVIGRHNLNMVSHHHHHYAQASHSTNQMINKGRGNKRQSADSAMSEALQAFQQAPIPSPFFSALPSPSQPSHLLPELPAGHHNQYANRLLDTDTDRPLEIKKQLG